MPNSRMTWNAREHQQDPVGDLTLAIRGLRMGDAITMKDGTMIKSTTMPQSGGRERRFAVIPADENSTAQERHRISMLGRNTFRRAEEAAKNVLGID